MNRHRVDILLQGALSVQGPATRQRAQNLVNSVLMLIAVDVLKQGYIDIPGLGRLHVTQLQPDTRQRQTFVPRIKHALSRKKEIS